MKEETIGQYLKRMGVILPPNPTVDEVLEAYNKAREQESTGYHYDGIQRLMAKAEEN